MWNKLLSNKRLGGNSSADEYRKDSSTMDNRTGAESDLGRVLFTTAARRLHDKTQVFPLVDNDHTHSRLTHSLEVMNAGMGFALLMLGKDSKDSDYKARINKLGVKPEDVLRKIQPILMTSCLVHDIGNPPFGHFGEDVISDYFTNLISDLERCHKEGLSSQNDLVRQIINYVNMKTLDDNKVERVEEDKNRRHAFDEFINDKDRQYDYTQFDGNAQGFRILTKLQYQDNLFGLNLTMGTLAATLKYPNTGFKNKKGPIGVHKHGVFTTERFHLQHIAEECDLVSADGKYKRHPLAFLMEAADSICYTVMDLDDAYDKGIIGMEDVIKILKQDENLSACIEKIYRRLSWNDIEKSEEVNWTNFRNAILKHLMDVAFSMFLDNFDSIMNGTYKEELIESKIFENGEERLYDKTSKLLGDFCKEKVLTYYTVRSLEVTGRAVITGLFNTYFSLLFHENAQFRKRGLSLLSRTNVLTTMHEHYDYIMHGEKNTKIAEKVREECGGDFDPIELGVEEIFRMVRDEVAGMTDNYALEQYQKLSGQNI